MRLIAPLMLAGAALPSLAATAPTAPVVIELYQSQGCSSCPPADLVLNQLAARSDVIALNFAVTYWDRLGWKDTFARPEFTHRQEDYARAAGRTGVSTPQMIINGREAIVGSRPAEVASAIARARSTPAAPDIRINGSTISIAGGSASQPVTLWLVRYDPRTVQVSIRAGENGGRTIPHRNIVRELIALGTWNGRAGSVARPPAKPGVESAVLLQSGRGGSIIAARRL